MATREWPRLNCQKAVGSSGRGLFWVATREWPRLNGQMVEHDTIKLDQAIYWY